MQSPSNTTEIAVVGAGPAGLIAALAIADSGAETVLVAPAPAHRDPRTTALLGGSVDVLREIGVWDRIADRTAPLRKLRLVDGTRRLIRAPELLFDSSELNLEAFGFNIENETLLAALRNAVAERPALRIVESAVGQVSIGGDAVSLQLGNGERIAARLVVAADGRNSVCREAAGISVSKRSLPQTAVALNLKHSRPHKNISTEFHTESGPFTLVPLPGLRSSLVWVCGDDDAERVRNADDNALAEEIERKSHSILGETAIDVGKGVFPLAVQIAERFGANRVALVGESGHVLPPIGAQGLNLGIRDTHAIARLAARSRAAGQDTGSEAVLADYDAQRRLDVRSRAFAVELLGRSLLSGFLPVHLARGLGLELASRIGLFRRALMRGGMGDTSARPEHALLP